MKVKKKIKNKTIFCYRYNSNGQSNYVKTYLKLKKFEKTDKATSAFGLMAFNYHPSKLLETYYFDSPEAVAELYQGLLESFYYLIEQSFDSLAK